MQEVEIDNLDPVSLVQALALCEFEQLCIFARV